MHVEAFRRRRKHARSRPLLRPQPDACENPFLASDEFTKKSAMSLWINLSRKNFHTRYPGFFDLALGFVGGHKFAGIYPSLCQLLREGCDAIITAGKCTLCTGFNALP